MIAVDSSVAVAAFATWHAFHERALDQLDRGPSLPAHAALETYSVLTRLPAPMRVAPEPVVDFLAARFPQPWLTLDGPSTSRFLAECRARGVVGGATYDALIAAAAHAGGASLVSCDRRAAEVYRRLDIEFDLIGGSGR